MYINKNSLNSILRRFGFELHGVNFMHALQKPSFKENPFQKQKDLVPNAKTIFDVGANVGDTVDQYTALFPHGSIYAFEPFDASFQKLQARTKNNPFVSSYPAAIGSATGKKTFYVNHSADTNSLYESQAVGLNSDIQVATKTSVQVSVWTLDSFCKQTGISTIDILKLDIQGGELEALKGAETFLKHKQIRLIYLETYFISQYKGAGLFPDIVHYLHQFGYRLQDLYNPIYGNGSLAWCDAIFLPV